MSRKTSAGVVASSACALSGARQMTAKSSAERIIKVNRGCGKSGCPERSTTFPDDANSNRRLTATRNTADVKQVRPHVKAETHHFIPDAMREFAETAVDALAISSVSEHRHLGRPLWRKTRNGAGTFMANWANRYF